MDFPTVAVIGSGTMGHGIAQVCAQSGRDVVLHDSDEGRLAAAVTKIRSNLDKGVEKGKLEASARDSALARISTARDVGGLGGRSLYVEAIPERLEWKQELFARLEEVSPPDAVFATNTSSLSVARIAASTRRPTRVIGTHFFNPVHIMALLEIVVHDGTDPAVTAAIQAFGVAIGKECITVRDVPGFATSRLGVCLGMEAIRMVEQGVASAEDIDKAMVLGYRHPVGPLRLTDMVGLDVRLNIGEYLARELGNAAFEPPALMRRMVAEGRLGQKAGKGFYDWGG
jgi:3-hydroxybutyryl-CoA dehydrogenase